MFDKKLNPTISLDFLLTKLYNFAMLNKMNLK